MSNSPKSLVLISGYYGFGNLGDEAILESIIRELEKSVAKDKIVVLSNAPETHREIYGVEAVSRWKAASLLKLLPKAKLFISGGGGLFQDTKSPGSTIYYGGQIALARAFGAHPIIFAQGLGPLDSETGKVATRLAAKLSQDITVRDKASLAMLENWKIKAELTADPVWTLDETALPEGVGRQIDKLRNGNRLIVGLSLRNSHNFSEGRRAILLSVLLKTLPKDAALVLLPLQKEQDLPQLEPFLEAWKQAGRQGMVLDTKDLKRPSQWVSLMRHLDLVVAMRLHALIFALKEGIPVLGLTYDAKVEHVLRQFGQPILILPKEGGDDQLEQKWLDSASAGLQDLEKLGAQARENAESAKKLACRNFQLLAKILDIKN
ncbi:MAG: polysaccharide pyruvyl transferase CsaB [Candidatus Obscuribacterales bacterium]|nr:polysaccharide pyruvyl transferase CsaB [Candidatus Obscuribacterales bacterium]